MMFAFLDPQALLRIACSVNESKLLSPRALHSRANGVLLLLAVHIIPQTAKHPTFAPPVPPEDTELQPSTLVSVLTYRLCPLRRVPLIKQNP